MSSMRGLLTNQLDTIPILACSKKSSLSCAVDRMFKVAKLSLFQLPIVVSNSVMASQDAGGRGSNFFRGFQFADGHSLFERLQFLPDSLHGRPIQDPSIAC